MVLASCNNRPEKINFCVDAGGLPGYSTLNRSFNCNTELSESTTMLCTTDVAVGFLMTS
jgi:hypothetical protein